MFLILNICLLLVYQKAINFSILTYSCKFPIRIISFRRFYCCYRFWGNWVRQSCYLQRQFYSSYLGMYTFYIQSQLARTSIQSGVSVERGDSPIPWSLWFQWEGMQFSIMKSAGCRFFIDVLYQVGGGPISSQLAERFCSEQILGFVKCLFCTYQQGHEVFSFSVLTLWIMFLLSILNQLHYVYESRKSNHFEVVLAFKQHIVF